jgi:hypothetical protein
MNGREAARPVRLIACLALLAGPVLAGGLTEADLYTHRDTWQGSLVASLGNLQKLEDQEREAAGAADENGLILGPWYACASFSNEEGKGFAAVYPPERETALDATYPAMSDSRAQWRRMDAFSDGEVHTLNEHYTLTEYAIAYLYRNVHAEHDVQITGYFGSDDGLAVWLNGEKLISNDVPRGPAPDQDQAPLRLKAGDNALLLKIVNRTGGWGFYFSTKPGGGGLGQNPTHIRRVNQLWDRLRADFTDPESAREIRNEQTDAIWPVGWSPSDMPSLHVRYRDAANAHLSGAQTALEGLRTDLGTEVAGWEAGLKATRAALEGTGAPDPEGARVPAVRRAYLRATRLGDFLVARARLVSLGLAVTDLEATFGARYGRAREFRQALAELRDAGQGLAEQEVVPAAKLGDWESRIIALQREALVTANPLLDFGRLMFITRRPGEGNPGLPQNWQSNSSLPRTGFDSAISVLSPVRPDGDVTDLYRAQGPLLSDLCPSFDASRVMFSMPAEQKGYAWELWETGTDGTGLRMVTQAAENDYDNYDACYLPNGQILFTSSRCYQAVPCTGGDHVSLAYVMEADGSNVRQLTFDQDHSWNPRVMNDGRIMYTRWEYNDIPHYFSRILFGMNPDGTRQMALYGSNSFFPNTIIGARPIPGDATRVVAIISGHHGNPRMGEVAIIDTSKGELEADGLQQIIPQRHREVEPVIVDQYATGEWPQFTQPYPLSDKYFLVSCKPSPDGWWGLYLVDVFDNVVPILERPGAALMEPIPLRATPTPPVIPAAVNCARQDATVYLFDVYRGSGLAEVPRGTVKKLRIVEPTYRYWGNAETHTCAIDGTWDVKKIWGTVPVEPDGSAYFKVPANTPLIVQPLDGQGQALQQMRSWFTAMPGETVSCVGCHERRRDAVLPGQRSQAQRHPASEIANWYGEPRGFSFEKEVQPILDRNCVRCHSGGPVDLRGRSAPEAKYSRFSAGYEALHPFVRRPGNESDIHMLAPREFCANTSQLVQMLRKGHKGVKLSDEDWDRLTTWIDLNVPYAGNWRDALPAAPEDLIRRREELRAQDYAVRQAAARGVGQ